MTAKSHPASSVSVGIDIGGTKMALGLLGPDSAVLERTVLSTEAELGFARAVDRLGEAITAMLAASENRRLAGIGIGCAGPLDARRGLINNPYTLTGWDQCDIVTPLQKRFSVPVFLENDADVAAVGEVVRGAGRGFDPVVMLTFGTGIGGAAIMAGSIYRGVNGEHPELGHLGVTPEGPECYCGSRGCLESIASGTAIGNAGKELGWGDARSVFAAAAQGQTAAVRIIDAAVEAAARAAWTLCHTLLPQRLVLGGGMMEEHFDLFAREIERRLAKATQFTPSQVSVARAALGNEAGLVGAGSLVWQRTHADPV